MQHTSENMQFLYSGHYYEGQLTNCREFITINYPPPWVFVFPPYGASCAMLNIDWTPLFLQQKIFWGLLTLFGTSDWISTRVLDARMQFRFCSLWKHETVSVADSSGPDPGGRGAVHSPRSQPQSDLSSDFRPITNYLIVDATAWSYKH